MADKRGREYDPIKGAERKRKQRLDPVKRKKMNEACMEAYRHNTERYRAYMRDYHFKTKYGITAAQKDEMVLAVGNKCEICFETFAERAPNIADAHLDHCHTTNKIRGILCGSCNRKLGWYEKNRQGVDAYLTKRE